jgi:hypothetical protein
MTRLWLLTAALLALALVACGGPDCLKYCTKLDQCATQLQTARPDIGHCLDACKTVGGEKADVISCVIDTSCQDLPGGRCTPTGGQFPGSP